jgi:hypothetical protein
MKTCWNIETHDVQHGPCSGALTHLRDDSSAVIVLKNVIRPEKLHDVAAALERHRNSMTVSTYSNAALTTFGPYLARHLPDAAPYFAEAGAMDGGSFPVVSNLSTLVRARVREALQLESLSPACEPDGRMYSAAVIRIHGHGVSNPLHNDRVMRDAAGSGLTLERLELQFSCVTCIQECNSGGELMHYRRRWKPEDERFKANGLGYRDGVVDGAEVCTFRPQTGDVYLIDPTNYHAIRAVQGQDRLTMGFFFGFFEGDPRRGICWS